MLAGCALLVVVIDERVQPILADYGKNQATWTATKIIHEAATRALADADTDYAELIRVERDAAGDIRAVEADMAQVNRLKSALSTAVVSGLQEAQTLEVPIPLGTILGGESLGGRGPLIPFRARMSGAAVTAMHSRFSDAGINQTAHQITLEVTARMVLVFPGYTMAVEVETGFLVAETVLVGEVPDSYTEVSGEQADLLGKIFAYGGKSDADV